MKANKTTLTVVVEVLSIDSVASLLMETAERIRCEYVGGSLHAQDGDNVSWTIQNKEVTI